MRCHGDDSIELPDEAEQHGQLTPALDAAVQRDAAVHHVDVDVTGRHAEYLREDLVGDPPAYLGVGADEQVQ